MATPTKEWQEQLARKLAYGNQWAYPNASMSPISRSSSSAGGSKDSARTRRRLDYPGQPSALSHVPQNWDNLYTLTDASRTSFSVPVSLAVTVLTLLQRRASPIPWMRPRRRLVTSQWTRIKRYCEQYIDNFHALTVYLPVSLSRAGIWPPPACAKPEEDGGWSARE